MFRRNLDPKMVEALNVLYGDSGSWWRALLRDKDVFVAIRDGYLNVYAKGGSIARVGFEGGRLTCQVHAEYLTLGEYEYIKLSDQGLPQNRSMVTTFNDYVTHLRQIKNRVAKHSGLERAGENEIAARVNTVLDIEAAFSGKDEGLEAAELTPERDQKGGRIDMVVLRKDGVLIFIEVKDHSNHKDLRSKTRPPVCDQLLEYHEWLKDHRDEVAAAYTNSRKLLKQINCRHPLAGDEPLKVDTIPRLLIFGYDTPQQTKLRKEIVPLIVRCTAQEIKGFGGQHVLARGAASGFTDEQLE